MKLTQDELISIISDVTALLGDTLAKHVELTETVLSGGGAGVEVQRKKLEKLQYQLADEKSRLVKLKDAEKRKKELEKANERHHGTATKCPQHESTSTAAMTPLLNERGVVIGWIQPTGGDRTNILDRKGRVVARELNGITVDARGRLRGRGRQGLRVLGQSMAA